MKSIPGPNIQHFTDYRNFLLCFNESQKKKNPNWSYGVWSQKLGLKDTSSLTKIVNGQRNPGSNTISSFSKYFKFNKKEKEYFEDLIRLQKSANDPRLSVILLKNMEKKFPNSQVRILDLKSFSVISHWYGLAIREMVRLSDFQEDPKWISSILNFKVTPTQVQKMLDTLLELKLIVRNENNRLVISSEGRIHTENDIASEALKRYHEQNLENASLALRTIDVKEREFLTSCFNMKKSNVLKAKELIREFKNNFVQLLEEEQANDLELFQLQMQFYPLTNLNEEGI